MRQKRRWFVSVILVTGCLCMLSAGCRGRETDDADMEAFTSISEEAGQRTQADDVPEETENAAPEDTGSAADGVFIYICGEVTSPGVYELPKDSRVADAILAAGGMTEEAAREYLNQAALLEDGQKVYVPSEEELKEPSQLNMQPDGSAAGSEGLQGSGTGADGRVNLNTAGKAELMSLSGIGESRAEAILAYRQEYGRFESIEDIKKIEGIKEGIFSRIKDRLTV